MSGNMKKPKQKKDVLNQRKDLLDIYEEIIGHLAAAKELSDGKVSECGYQHIQLALTEVIMDWEFMISITNEKKSDKNSKK